MCNNKALWQTRPKLPTRGFSQPTHDGALLLIEPGNRWENEDIVIAWIDGEVTCKRLQLNHSPALLVRDNRDYKVIQVQISSITEISNHKPKVVQ